MNKLMLVGAMALATATPALAQDEAPFTGLRIEGVVGWDRQGDGTGQRSAKGDGVVYGAQVGYDKQMGGVILGIEGELTWASTKTRARNVLVAGDELFASTDRDLYLGARIGVPLSSTAMIYAKGGWTNARYEGFYSTPSAAFDGSNNSDGFRLGAGTELKLTGRTYLKAEYRYSNYGDGPRTDVDRHQLVGGVGFRF
jgi:outer membrane immunogenic protein